jgi:stage V sporulation protein SpoVS
VRSTLHDTSGHEVKQVAPARRFLLVLVLDLVLEPPFRTAEDEDDNAGALDRLRATA